MPAWSSPVAPLGPVEGPSVEDIEAIELMLSAAGVPETGPVESMPVTLRERVAWLTSAACVVRCDRCDVTYRVVQRGSAETVALLDRFLAEHRHRQFQHKGALVEHLRRHELFPGDVVEVQLASQASRETLNTVRGDVERLVPDGVQVIVLARPSSLTVKLCEERRRPGVPGRRPA